MKNLLLFVVLIMASCTYRGSHPVSKNIVQRSEAKDEYEVIIIDNNFNNWMITNGKPSDFYSESYYKQQNQKYIAAWNQKVTERNLYKSRNYPFEERIDYNPNIQYGIEVEHQLFWYFRYTQDVYGRKFNFPGPGGRG